MIWHLPCGSLIAATHSLRADEGLTSALRPWPVFLPLRPGVRGGGHSTPSNRGPQSWRLSWVCPKGPFLTFFRES